MSTFLTCSEQLDQIKLNLLERVPTVAISTFFENKLWKYLNGGQSQISEYLVSVYETFSSEESTRHVVIVKYFSS